MKSRFFVRPMLMVGVLLLAILACLPGPVPTAVPPTEPPPPQAPPDTAAPPPTEAPTATAMAQDYFTDEFETDTGQWSRMVVDATIQLTSPYSLASVAPGDVGNMTVGVNDGHLLFDLNTKGLWVYEFYDPYEYEDVRMDVVAENRGTNDNNVSLVCRYSKDEGWYEFNIANSGLYDILHGKITADGKVTYGRIADGGSNKIKQGKETNTYSIVCKGRTLVLYINNIETRRVDDNQYALQKGKVGVSVSSFNTLPVKVQFESVKISKP